MRSLEHYLSVAKEAVAQVAAENSEPLSEEDRRELWKALFSGSKYEQLVSTLRLVKSVLPASIIRLGKEKLKDIFYHSEKLPFNPQKYSYEGKIGHGGQSQVFLLENKDGENTSLVLKVLRYTSRDGKKPMEQLQASKAEYEYLRKMYSEEPEIIPPEYFVILSDPFHKNKAAGAVIQPFFGGNIMDVFDLETEEFHQMMSASPKLRKQFSYFCEVTLNHERETGEVVDLLGPKNISIVETEGEPQLILLDPHAIKSTKEEDATGENDVERRKVLRKRLGRLAELSGIEFKKVA